MFEVSVFDPVLLCSEVTALKMTIVKIEAMVTYYTNLESTSVTLSLLAVMLAETSLTTSFPK